LVGYIPFLSKLDPEYPHLALKKLSDHYGPVTGFYLGPSQPFISVCGYQAVREALYNEDLAGRPSNAARRERTFGQRLGVIHNDGPEWQEQRRFALRHLRDLGFGRTSSEGLIREEIEDLMEEIRAHQLAHGSVDFKGMFNLSLINILWALVGGERFRRDDRRLARLLDIVDNFVRSADFTRANIPLPDFCLRYFPSLTRKLLGLRNDLFTPLQDFIRVNRFTKFTRWGVRS
jgi:methyl farnesoate epoxidase / farnesoate epoxidase